MKVRDSEKKVVTVWLDPDSLEDDRLKMFFCFNCRTPLIEYSGNVTQIVPGEHPYEPKTVLKCSGKVWHRDLAEQCGVFYAFMGNVQTKNPLST